MSAWTPARVERLQELVSNGRSAREIANELGGGITRNAVIGKMSRDGIKTIRTRREPSMERRMKAVKKLKVYNGHPTMVDYKGVEPMPETIEIPMEQRKTLLELGPTSCRFPLGDPGTHEFRFCGGEQMIGSPYCAFHTRRAYMPRPR